VQFLFEDFAIDTDRRELLREGHVLRVEFQVFDLLAYLIQHRDHVVSKDDLFTAVWDGRIVSESAPASRINAARSMIGDNGRRQRLIKTLPRRGFASSPRYRRLVGDTGSRH
jgi:adenylate cyclase